MERVVLLFVQVLIVPALTAERPTKTTTSNECTLPLGMEEGKIPDDAITASSSYEMKSVGPQNARIRQEKNGGAWCPKAQISSAIREYLEVDLTKDHLIAWTETQGRFGNGQGQEYAEAFFLEYWRDGKWHQYKTLKGDKVLRGNSNTYLVERQKLDLPFVASRVRFVPYSQHPRTVCMRVEIYGCIWERRILNYVAPKGEADGPNGCNLEDFSYDGIEIDGIARNGLGQLTDGILGDIADILASSAATNWVGWSNRSIVELVFEFYDIREFENCTIHVADLPEYEIEVFSTVLVWFSFNGRAYHSTPEKLEITEKAKTNSNNYLISLQSRTGRFVKLEIRTRSKWLVISEVTFKSVPGARNISDESSQRSSTRNNSAIGRDYSEKTTGHPNETIFELNEADLTPDAFPVGNSQAYVGLVSGILTVTALLLTCTIFLMKQRGRNKVALLQKHTALLCGSPAPGITINVKDVKLTTPIVANGTNLSQSRLSLKSCKSSVITSDRSTREPLANRSCGSNVISSEYEHCSFDAHHQYSSEDDPIYETHPQLGNSSSIVESSDTDDQSTTRDTLDSKTVYSFANDCPATSAPIAFSSEKSTTSGNHQTQVARSSHKFYDSYYAATDILTIRRREQLSAASLFTPLRIRNSTRPLNNLNSHAMRRISRHRLRILDKLGEGSFGLVHLCEAKGIQTLDLGVVRNRQTVIVRSLWRGVVDSLREDFRRDMHVLATIRDVNIAGVIALVEEEPFGAVFEYGDLGDLPTFLENHEASNGGAHLSSECCMAFVTQIASGMRCLESLNIPHCDLAARNCIVDQHLTIKVSDHAMYCNKYDRQYYVDGSYKKVPLRWMAWEAIILNKHSCRTDVWSYAVTVWEILSQCKNLPYSELTSEQVLENCSRWYHDNGTTERDRPRILPQPSCCSDELYRTMLKCWSKQPEERPTFDEIYFRLRKSGYD